jgi:hypothetical protein
VVEAVLGGPVSNPKFPDNREINREFFKFGPFSAIPAPNQRANSIACRRIPYEMEQGIFLTEQGILTPEQGIRLRTNYLTMRERRCAELKSGGSAIAAMLGRDRSEIGGAGDATA